MKSMRPSEVMYSSTSESKTDVLTAKPFRATVVDAMLFKYHKSVAPKEGSLHVTLHCEAFIYILFGNKGAYSSMTTAKQGPSLMLQWGLHPCSLATAALRKWYKH